MLVEKNEQIMFLAKLFVYDCSPVSYFEISINDSKIWDINKFTPLIQLII